MEAIPVPFHPLVGATSASVPSYVDSQICQDAQKEFMCRHSDSAQMRKRRRYGKLQRRRSKIDRVVDPWAPVLGERALCVWWNAVPSYPDPLIPQPLC